MDRKNIKDHGELDRRFGKRLEEAVQRFQLPHPDRFLTFTEPSWDHSNQPDYGKFQADEIERAHKAGARG